MTAHDPLRFLDQLEADWQATQQVAPGRDRRLDDLYDSALIAIGMRAGMPLNEAVRAVAQARATHEQQQEQP